MTTYRMCSSCGRPIVETLFDRASAHAPGCTVRRSLLAKANFKQRQARKLRAQKAAATRLARRAAKLPPTS